MDRLMTETLIYGPVSDDVALVGERLKELGNGHHPLLAEALTYVFQTSGKRIRPALVMLSGKLGRYRRDRLVTLAASLEVVHTATLVHDDTVDGAKTRRGLETISALWNPKVAILTGDFLFAQSAELAARLDSVPIMTLLAETVMAMSTGELRQYASSEVRLIDEGDYFLRIGGKTASLFAMCCEGAAIVSEQSEEQRRALRSYGTNLGLAFQIADDVLDFVGDEQDLGKPAGNDLRQGTVTLPVILWAQGEGDRSDLLRDLQEGRNVEAVIAAVRESGAVRRGLQRAQEYAAAARADLSIFPASEAKRALIELTERVTARRN
jgi:geranylgeranyl pyrophosphate synthase